MKKAEKQLREAKIEDDSKENKHIVDCRKKTPTLKELTGLHREFMGF